MEIIIFIVIAFFVAGVINERRAIREIPGRRKVWKGIFWFVLFAVVFFIYAAMI